jgi:Na+-translocating ferredoxin:NAD+ oxidoreductase RnfA subunit
MVIRALEIVNNFYAVKFLGACRSVKKAKQTESISSLVVPQAALQ